MRNLLRSLALGFLVLGAVCAVDAAATGQHTLEAAACFTLEFVFLWLNRRRSAAPSPDRGTPALSSLDRRFREPEAALNAQGHRAHRVRA